MILRPIFVLLAAAALAACSEVSSNPPAGDGGAPPEVVAAARDWPLPGRDYRNSRATFDTRIDSTTIASLAQAWKVDLPGVGGYGNASTTPLVLGDTVYVQDLTSVTRAIDLATGAVRWKTPAWGPTIGPTASPSAGARCSRTRVPTG